MDLMRCEIVFIGRVQGVGFRATAQRLADEHGVVGWVRNEADGSVRLVVEGLDHAVAGYLGALRVRLASFIRDERATTSADTGRYAGFEIR